MTTAEKLRVEMAKNLPFTKEAFINEIVKQIRGRGRAPFYCDRHIKDTNLTDAITLRDEDAVISMATSEGFNYHYEYNYYGVRKIVFTL